MPNASLLLGLTEILKNTMKKRRILAPMFALKSFEKRRK